MEKKRKILVVGDYNCFTGFANVNHNIFDRLKDDFEIEVCASNYNGLRPYHPSLFPVYGTHSFYAIEEMLPIIDRVNPDIIYTLNDGFVTPDFATRILNSKSRPAWVAHVVFDALPIRKEWADCLRYASRIVFPTEWQAKEFAKVYPDLVTHVIYHGVDTKKFFPFSQNEISEYKKAYFKTDNVFVFGMVAKNFQRKRYPELLQAFKIFKNTGIDKDKPAILFLHTDRPTAREAYNFQHLVKQIGIPKELVMLSSKMGLTEEEMNVLYNLFDVNCLISIGEGYGLPTNHAAAVGKPTLACENSVQKDLCDKSRAVFLCEENEFETYFCEDDNYVRKLPNIKDLAGLMQNIYKLYLAKEEPSKKDRETLFANALIFANSLDWETKIVPLWKHLFENVPIGTDRKVVEI